MKLSQFILIQAILILVAQSKLSLIATSEHSSKQQHHLRHKTSQKSKVAKFGAPCDDSLVKWKQYLIGKEESVICAPVERNEQKSGLLDESLKSIKKRVEMDKIRISSGYSAYYFDQTDPFFIDPFKKDALESFLAFVNLPDFNASISNIYQNKEVRDPKNKQINFVQLKTGVELFNWRLKGDIGKLFRQYDLNDNYMMNFKEFLFFNIIENLKGNPIVGSLNNLPNIKNEINSFFNYMDCDKDGYVSSQDLYRGFANIKTDYKILSIMTNDFLLKAMEQNSATLDNKDFLFAQLVGMYERIVATNAIDDESIIQLRQIRKINAQKGGLEGKVGQL